MSTKRRRILEAIGALLERIRVTNGYDTDAGLAVFYGPVSFGPDDVPLAIAIIPGDTETNPVQAGKKVITLPVEIHAVAREHNPQPGIPDNAWLQAELVLGDVKRAIEAADQSLGGLAVHEGLAAGEVTPLPRQEGSAMLGMAIVYRIIYTEVWGNPDR